MGIKLSDSVENIVEKREIARYEQFLLFLQCFQSCLLLIYQNEYQWSKGLKRKWNANVRSISSRTCGPQPT